MVIIVIILYRMLPSRTSLTWFLTLGLLGPVQIASAYLGSFEEADGYRIPGAGGSGNIASGFFVGDSQFYLNNTPANGFTGIVAPGAYPNGMGDAKHGADVSRYNAGQYGTGGSGPGGAAAAPRCGHGCRPGCPWRRRCCRRRRRGDPRDDDDRVRQGRDRRRRW